MFQQQLQLEAKPEVKLQSLQQNSQEQIVIQEQIEVQEQLQQLQQLQQQNQKGTMISIPVVLEKIDINDSDHIAKLTAWSERDERTKMYMERYNRYGGSHNYRSVNLNATNTNNEIGEERPSKIFQSVVAPEPKKTQTSQTYFSSTGSKKFVEVPKPISFDNETVQLKYRDQILYWPIKLVTRASITDRFEIKKPILKVAVSSSKTLKIFPNLDGSFPVSAGSTYVIANKKKKDKKEAKVMSAENKIVHFLTLDRFVRGEKKRDLVLKTQYIREESFEFFDDNRVYYREMIGNETLQEKVSFEGKWRLNETYSRVIIKYPKPVKKKLGEEKFNLFMEKQAIYTGFFFPGDGSIQCERNHDLIFK